MQTLIIIIGFCLCILSSVVKILQSPVTPVLTTVWTLDHLKYTYLEEDRSFTQAQLGTDGVALLL